MAAVAIGLALDQRRAVAGPGPVGRLGDRRIHGLHVVAIHDHPRNAIRRRSIGHMGHRRGHFVGAVLAVQVVLADKQNRQLPHRGEVDAFMEGADVGRSIAKGGRRHGAGPEHLRGQPSTHGHRDPSAHDGEGRQQAALKIGQVHRAALAA